jgi:hypothetical protein
MTYTALKYQGKISLEYQYILKREMKGRRVKKVFPSNGYQWDGCEHKESVNEGKYGGCILYSYTKTEGTF